MSSQKFRKLTCTALFIALLFTKIQSAEEVNNQQITLTASWQGHSERPIGGNIQIPNQFNPQDFQQNRSNKETACVFSSMLAGMMHTSYGRQQIQNLISHQDENAVYFKFHTPSTDVINQYNCYHEDVLSFPVTYLERLEKKYSNGGIETEYYEEEKRRVKDIIARDQQAWNIFSQLQDVIVCVPKKNMYCLEHDSFPHNSASWVNLLEQAYLTLVKNNVFLQKPHEVDYAASRNYRFSRISPCTLMHQEFDECSCPSKTEFSFYPLIPVNPLKEIKFNIEQYTNDNAYTLKTIESFKEKGLTKDLLIRSNVLQFNSADHAVTLFFGKEDGKVYYYDNAIAESIVEGGYDSLGPIYEEATFFKGKDLNEISEIDFFSLLGQEIFHRVKQVAAIRDEKQFSNTTLIFFTNPLE